MDRRIFTKSLAAALGSLSAMSYAADTVSSKSVTTATQAPAGAGKQKFVMLAYENMTALDLVGPQLFFATLGNIDLKIVAKSKGEVTTDSGLKIVVDSTFADVTGDVDLLFVPGGLRGTTDVLNDVETMAFVRKTGVSAKYVTSVCTGGLILAGAGLLNGYKATTHWYVHHLLANGGAIPVAERVVVDRNRITGGGVTAGLDFALMVSTQLRGAEYAKRQQLVFEYDPHPMYDEGSPKTANPATVQSIRDSRKKAIDASETALKAAVLRAPQV